MGTLGWRWGRSAAWAPAILTLAAAACTASWMLAEDAVSQAPWVTVDDTYYYLLAAWHRVHDGFASADGIHPTNGVQLLWYWGLVGIAAVVESREALLTAALWLCAALVVLAVPVAYGAGAALRDRAMGVAFALTVLWLGQGEPILVSGLESALYLVLVLLSIWAYASLLRRPSTGRLALLSLALSAAVLCRLDGAVWAAVLALHAAVELSVEHRRRGVSVGRPLGTGLAVGLASVALALASFRTMGGSWLPVSLLWKRTWRTTGGTPHVDWPAVPPGESLAEVARRVGDAFALGGGLAGLGSIVLTALLVLSFTLIVRDALGSLGLLAPHQAPPPDAAAGRLTRGVPVAAAGLALHTGTLVVTADRPWPWYFVPALVLVALLVASLAARLRDPPRVERAGRWPWLTAVSLLGLLAAASAAARWLEVSSSVQTANLATERIAVARWVREHLPPGTRAGALNSGELGFFSGLPVTNLDGLVNSAGYYRYRRSGGSLLGYLRAEGIRYFVDYNVPVEIAQHSVLLHSRSLAGVAGAPPGRTLEVRRLEEPSGSRRRE